MATNENYYTILTSYGKQALANAQASGTAVNITEFAVGDGNGSYYAPNETQTALKNEVYRAQINRITTDSDNPNWIIVEGIIPADQGGFTIREIGIFDDQNKLVAIGNYPETYKPVLSQGAGNDMYIRFIMEVENVDSVQLKIDPAIVLASRKYVDDEITAHNSDQTSHNIPGQISTAINNHNTNTSAHADIRDSAAFAKLNGINFKNFIINGDFQIWQRGTTGTGATNGTFTADRWAIFGPTGDITFDWIRVAADNDLLNQNLYYGLKIQKTAGADPLVLYQFIENLGQFIPGEKVTISFYAKSTTATTPYNIEVALQATIGRFTETTPEVVSQQLTVDDTLKRFTVTLTVPNYLDTNYLPSFNWGQLENTALILKIRIPDSNVLDDLVISGVQLEKGENATDFEYIPADIQHIRCLRYYEAGENIINGTVASSAIVYASVHLAFKRTIPTITLWKTYGSGGAPTVREVERDQFSYSYGGSYPGDYIAVSFIADAEF
ncbi:phage tail protein [Persephonella sp.]